MTDALTLEAKRDDFSTESPVRAFTDFQVAGNYAIGKGFRPALAHLARYLDAMERKEGWALVQIIEAANPTIIFVKLTINAGLPPLHTVTMLAPDLDRPFDLPREPSFRTGGVMEHVKPVADDPINPKHYNGRECADIGELMTANSYQVLKYNWRLGEKDSPCVELGKALWYLDSEIRLATEESAWGVAFARKLPNWVWIEERLAGKDHYVVEVTRLLYAWNTLNDVYTIKCLRNYIQAKLDSLNGCSDWGRGLEP